MSFLQDELASLQILTQLVLGLHILAGAAGLMAGTAAALARKGASVHRGAGKIFVVSMCANAASACYLGIVLPGQIINLFIGGLSLYLVATGWLALAHPPGRILLSDKIALAVSLSLCAPFAILIVQTITGGPALINSNIALKGPVLIALYAFSGMLAMAAVGDARLVLAGGITGKLRIARHLWRMCLGLTFAAGSGFTNGLARLLPGPYHVPIIFFLPQFLPLGLMIFWLIRLRIKGMPNQNLSGGR